MRLNVLYPKQMEFCVQYQLEAATILELFDKFGPTQPGNISLIFVLCILFSKIFMKGQSRM